MIRGFGTNEPTLFPSGRVWLQVKGSNANLTSFGVLMQGSRDRQTNAVTYDRPLSVWSDDKDTVKAVFSPTGAELTVGGATRTLLESFARAGGIPGLSCQSATCSIKRSF